MTSQPIYSQFNVQPFQSQQPIQPVVNSQQAYPIPNTLIAKGHRRKRSFSVDFILMILTAIAGLAFPPLLIIALALWLKLLVLSYSTYYEIWTHSLLVKQGLWPRYEIMLAPSQFQTVWRETPFFNHFTNDKAIKIRTPDTEALAKLRGGDLIITGLGHKKEMDRIWQCLRDMQTLAAKRLLP